MSALRLAEIEAQMTDLDWSILFFMQEVRLATGAQLRRCFWTDDDRDADTVARTVRRVLARLTDWRVIGRLPRAVGGVRAGSQGHVHFIGSVGYRLLARRGSTARRFGRPTVRLQRHCLAVTELVVELHEADARGDLELIDIQSEPACWRAFLGPHLTRLWVRPDLFARLGVGALEDRWFIEVDMGTEGRGALLTKCLRLRAHLRSNTEQAEHGVYPRILWSAPDAARAKFVTAVIATIPDVASLSVITTADQAVARLAAEARS